MRTMAEIAQEAMEIQDASNIIAIANGLSNVTKELLHEHNLSHDEIATHPITTLWVSKLICMNSNRTDTNFAEDYCKVNDIIQGIE